MRAFLGILFFALVALAAGALGFQAGVASSVAAGTGGVPAIVYLGGGFNFGGFLFFLLFLVLIASVAAGRRRHWAEHAGGFGPMGYGRWTGGRGPMGDADPRREWVAEMHRRLHEEESAHPSGGADGPRAG